MYKKLTHIANLNRSHNTSSIEVTKLSIVSRGVNFGVMKLHVPYRLNSLNNLIHDSSFDVLSKILIGGN